MLYVIGSGPAGVACAQGLLARGLPVTLLDGGEELEPERRAALERLRAMDPARWRGPEAAFLKRSVAPDRKGIGTKYAYGSDFPYRDPAGLAPVAKEGCDLGPSLAVGGFSNVWGATLLPYRDSDTADWPFALAELAPHYEAVLGFVDASLEADDLAEILPLHRAAGPGLRRSRQAESLLSDLGRRRDELRRQGVRFGASRLAVRAGAGEDGPGCVYCGLCMYGCPHGLIYSAAATVAKLERHPLLARKPGLIVERVSEEAGGIQISGRDRRTGQPFELAGEKVFLAAGALNTTRILLGSLEAYDQPVLLQDSQYFLVPLLRYAAQAGAEREDLHTLAQAFIEILDPAVSPHSVHLQIYTYNELYAGALAKPFGPLAGLVRPFLGPLVRRMLIAQGYLHSDHAAPIEVRLSRQAGGPDLLRLEARTERKAETAAMLRRVVGKLARSRRALRAVPLTPLLHAAAPGRGYHSGGTFPMRRNPGPLESDLLGRPAGFSRVHAVDATVLPSIPATTITFSVMANAHRIATRA